MRIGDQTGKVKRVNAASLRSTAASGSRISIFAAGRSIRVLCLMCMTVLLLTGCKSRASELRLQGISELEKGKYEDAIKTLDEALQESNGKISREQFDILLYRAEAEYMTGDYDAAQHTLDILTKVDGKKDTYEKMQKQIDAKLLIKEASEALDKNDTATAREKLDEASANGLSNDRDQEYDEIVYLEKTGKWQEAYDAMQSYMTRYPGDKEAEREQSFLKTRTDALHNNPLLSGSSATAAAANAAGAGTAGTGTAGTGSKTGAQETTGAAGKAAGTDSSGAAGTETRSAGIAGKAAGTDAAESAAETEAQ